MNRKQSKKMKNYFVKWNNKFKLFINKVQKNLKKKWKTKMYKINKIKKMIKKNLKLMYGRGMKKTLYLMEFYTENINENYQKKIIFQKRFLLFNFDIKILNI